MSWKTFGGIIFRWYSWWRSEWIFNPLSANRTKWSNTQIICQVITWKAAGLCDKRKFTSFDQFEVVFEGEFALVLTPGLTLSWGKFLSYGNQSIDMLCKSVNWFLYDRDLRHRRDKCCLTGKQDREILTFKNQCPSHIENWSVDQSVDWFLFERNIGR